MREKGNSRNRTQIFFILSELTLTQGAKALSGCEDVPESFLWQDQDVS